MAGHANVLCTDEQHTVIDWTGQSSVYRLRISLAKCWSISLVTVFCYAYYFRFSPFTFHLGSVHLLQDVALHHCLPLSSACCFPVPGSSCFSLVANLCSVWVHLVCLILAICPAHLHCYFTVYSIMSIIFVLFPICEHDTLRCICRPNILFFERFSVCLSIVLLRDHVWQP